MNKKNKFFISKMIFIFVLASCFMKDRYKLSKEDKVWNPYENGQVLVFSSDEYQNDTIKIVDANDYVYPDAPVVLNYYTETLRIIASHKNSVIKGFSEDLFLEIQASNPEKESSIEFKIKLKESTFFGKPYSIIDLNELETISLKTHYKHFTDIIIIEDNYNTKNVKTSIKRIFWSKEFGYVKLENYNGISWELLDIIEK